MRRLIFLLLVLFLSGCSSPLLGTGDAVLPKPVEAPAVSVPQMGGGSGAVVPPVYALPQDHPLPRAEEIGDTAESGKFGQPVPDGPCKGFPKNKVQPRDEKQVEVMRFIKKEVLSSDGRLSNYPLWGERSIQNEILKKLDLSQFINPMTNKPFGHWMDLSNTMAFGTQNATEVFDPGPRGGNCLVWPQGTEREMLDIEKTIWNLLKNIT